MANESEILRRIRALVGLDMSRSADYDVLSQAIRDRTKENLGVNTLKRLFGVQDRQGGPAALDNGYHRTVFGLRRL